MIIAGVGFRSSASCDDIVSIVRRAQAQRGVAAQWLAVPDFKAESATLLEAAALLGIDLIKVERSCLEAVQSQCLARSHAAASATGLASIAEACALAALAPPSELILGRISNSRATCALARSRGP